MHPEATAPQNVSNKTWRNVFGAPPFTSTALSGYFDSYLLFSKWQQPHFLRSWCSLRIGWQGFNLFLHHYHPQPLKTSSSEFCPIMSFWSKARQDHWTMWKSTFWINIKLSDAKIVKLCLISVYNTLSSHLKIWRKFKSKWSRNIYCDRNITK